MNTRSLPRSMRVLRVLLWAITVIMAANVLTSLVDAGGGLFGLGYALPYAVLSALCVVCAIRLPRAERWVRVTVIVVLVIILLGEVGRFTAGDLRAVIGVWFPIAGLILVCRPTARRLFSAER